MMFIYKITNRINGKVYIGQTVNSVKARFRRHINDALNNVIDTHFARAIRKYGEQSFEIEIIDTACSQLELTHKEQAWITCYDSINSGYNETAANNKSGGNTYISKSESEMSEIRNKLSESKTGRNNPMARAIKCYNTKTNIELQFDTLAQCQSYFNEKTHRFITTRVTGVTRSLYKGAWKIAYAENEYGEFCIKTKRRGTPIRAVDLLSGKETVFNSMREASRTLHLGRTRMCEAIRSDGIINSRYKIEILDKKCIDYPR